MPRHTLPLEALNPYTPGWCIRAVASNKGALRTVKTQKGDVKVFSIELTDEQGTCVQATAWREAAEALHAKLEDGKAYYVSGGALKPANKAYSTSSFGYELALNEKSVVEECTDAVVSPPPPSSFDATKLSALGTKLGSKAPVDVLGVVTTVGELGSVQRKADGTQLARRDVTLVDETNTSVKLTLWGALAEVQGEELAAKRSPVLGVRGVRVSDYNGLSLSSVGRTQLVVEPQSAAADSLRTWFASTGASSTFTDAGAGFTGSRPSLGGAKAARKALGDVTNEDVPAADSKPEWCSFHACVVHIPDGTLYYAACPEEGCNKKVTQDASGRWLCEASGKAFDTCKRRYVLRFKAADATGCTYLQAFDDTAKLVFGCSADELHAEKEAGSPAFTRRMREAAWTPWVVKAKVSSEAYNGETRRRITATQLTRPVYAEESRALLQLLTAA